MINGNRNSRGLYLSFSCFLLKKYIFMIFPVAQTVKNLLAMQETQVQFLGQEDPSEKGMAIHSRILA